MDIWPGTQRVPSHHCRNQKFDTPVSTSEKLRGSRTGFLRLRDILLTVENSGVPALSRERKELSRVATIQESPRCRCIPEEPVVQASPPCACARGFWPCGKNSLRGKLIKKAEENHRCARRCPVVFCYALEEKRNYAHWNEGTQGGVEVARSMSALGVPRVRPSLRS